MQGVSSLVYAVQLWESDGTKIESLLLVRADNPTEALIEGLNAFKSMKLSLHHEITKAEVYDATTKFLKNETSIDL